LHNSNIDSFVKHVNNISTLIQTRVGDTRSTIKYHECRMFALRNYPKNAFDQSQKVAYTSE